MPKAFSSHLSSIDNKENPYGLWEDLETRSGGGRVEGKEWGWKSWRQGVGVNIIKIHCTPVWNSQATKNTAEKLHTYYQISSFNQFWGCLMCSVMLESPFSWGWGFIRINHPGLFLSGILCQDSQFIPSRQEDLK